MEKWPLLRMVFFSLFLISNLYLSHMKKYLILILTFGYVFSSCTKKVEKQLEEDKDIIKSYLLDNNISANCTASGLYYVFEEEGNGDSPSLGSQVLVEYKGYYPDGTVFEENLNNDTYFTLGQLIEGWNEGLQLFKEGGTGTLFIPSGLAYGPSGRGNIGGDAVLFFDMTLVDVDD